ncbi:MAG: thioredoxin [Sphingobacteriia bacterium]|nr:thioredoxin [Sphingobacteriia bacterium]
MANQISDENFDQEVLESNQPVLVDFWAEWCGPCRQLTPIIDSIAEEMKEKIKVVKVNIDNSPESPQKYGVRGIPTLMIFKDGKLLDTKVGALPKSSLVEWLEKHIA